MLVSSLAVAVSPVPPAADVSARLDTALEKEWKRANISPAGQADDATFLRRVYLDLTGRVPPPLKVREFLQDADPGKRAKLVDALLASEEFADYWGRTWTQALTGKRPIKQDSHDGRVLYEYMKASLAANKPYRDLVTELICGEGLSDASGPVNFLLRYDAKPTDLAGAVSKNFLGLTLQCAQCHNHPFAEWKKADFWGMAAFFGRTRRLDSQGDDGNYAAVLDTRRGDLMLPDPAAKPDESGNVPKKAVKPRLPGQDGPVPPGKRRQALAVWITSDKNPYFAKNLINRVWAQLFGSGLVASLEHAPAEGEPVHAEILTLLAKDFSAAGQDVKRLVRVIVLSRAYQLSAGSGEPATDPDTLKDAGARLHQLRHLGRFPVRPLSVDQLYQSVVQATGYRGPEPAPAAQNTSDRSPEEASAVQKPAAEDDDQEGEADIPVDQLGERALTVQRAQALLNSDYVQKAVQAGALAAGVVNGGRPGAAHVEWLFLSTLARRPTPDESATMLELLQAGKRKRGLEDVLWVLLNSAEFNTNH
jgi:hypothetical protein